MLLKIWNKEAWIKHSKLLEFETPRFADLDRDGNVQGKVTIFSAFGYFVGTSSDSVSIKMFIQNFCPIAC